MSRGKEYKGQTLVIDGSRSGASTVVTRLAYDSAFNLELIGEARYGSAETDQYWYIEKLSYDSAFNLTTVQTAQNRRILGPSSVTPTNGVTDDILTAPTSPINLFVDIRPGDILETTGPGAEGSFTVLENLGDGIRLDRDINASPAFPANTRTIILNDYVNKDFNKRTWTLRDFYVYE